MTDPSTSDGGVDWRVQGEEEREAVLAQYGAMTRKALKEVLIAEYRCRAQGCVLLHVWNAKHGRCYYHPRYPLAPQAIEEESTESARQQRMSGGKWVERAGSFDKLMDDCGDSAYSGTHLNCAHLKAHITGRRLAA